MLTDEERSLVRRAFQEGPGVLLEENYSAQDVNAFLMREDVRAELSVLSAEFNNQEALFGRAKFVAKRQLAKLSTSAVAILAQALGGPRYVIGQDGQLVLDARGNPLLKYPEPTSNQLRAAETILERVGVEAKMAVNTTADTNLSKMFRPVDDVNVRRITHDEKLQTEQERIQSREKIRVAIEKLLSKVPDAKKRMDEVLGVTGKKASRKRHAKRVDTVSKPDAG